MGARSLHFPCDLCAVDIATLPTPVWAYMVVRSENPEFTMVHEILGTGNSPATTKNMFLSKLPCAWDPICGEWRCSDASFAVE